MKRRTFLTLASLGGIASLSLLFSNSSTKRRIKGLVKTTLNFLRPTVDLPEEGKNISIETVLNSRCTSDYDGDPEKFHWGMFDNNRKLSEEQVKKIIALTRIPRFTDQKVEIQSKGNILTFVVQNDPAGILRDWMMIESGMQQQAVGLVCAALGVGMVFRNLGKDGTPISHTDYSTINIRLDPMKPTYNGSFWSSLPPTGRNHWVKGNLPGPVRDGNKPLISTLIGLKIENKGSTKSTQESISQLLWAARGRTPHLYNSKPWGMTVPTWAGKQHISSVYVISDNKLSKYINWDNHLDRPTHALSPPNKIDDHLVAKLERSFSPNGKFIIIGKNEDFARALWEVGYQLLNLLLQANSLDIPYQAVLLNEAQRSTVAIMGVRDPVAILAV